MSSTTATNNTIPSGRLTRAATKAAGIDVAATTATTTEHAAPVRTKKAPAKKPAVGTAGPGPQTQTITDPDAELKKELEAQRKQPFFWATQLPPVSEEDMASDFREFGFTEEQVASLTARKELIKVDGFAQRPFPGNGMSVEGTGPVPEKKVRQPRQPKYKDLVILEDQDWVLFDHLKGFPPQFGTSPPAFTKWAVFEPDNQRVLLQHNKSKSVRSQAVPENLKGKTVEYTPSGPRVADFEPIKNLKKKVACAAPAPAPAPAPVLGRGARRQVRQPLPSLEPTAAPELPVAAPPATKGKKRSADDVPSEEPAQPPKKRKTAAGVSVPETREASPAQPAPPSPVAAGKKRKADDTTVAAEDSNPPPPKRRARPTPPPKVLPPRALKGKRTTLQEVAEEEPAAAAEGPKPKRKRRPARPKLSDTIIENSSSE